LRNTTPIDSENADILRLIVTWRMWGPRAVRTTQNLMGIFTPMRAVVALCSREGILATDLMRFPRVLEAIPGVVAPSMHDRLMVEFNRLYDARNSLGLVLVDQERLKKLAASRRQHGRVQTPYIPPRIWSYQVTRLRACLDDFLAHRNQIERCFAYCVDAYVNKGRKRRPFGADRNTEPHLKAQGLFTVVAKQFGIRDLLDRWVGFPRGRIEIRNFTNYLTMVQLVGLAYIANFTLQRIDEAASLRVDCLLFELDEQLGRVPIICGETTKTDADSDARWPTSPSVQVAVDAMSCIARLRIQAASVNPAAAPADNDQGNPYLFDRPFEPWVGAKRASRYLRPKVKEYRAFLTDYPKLFDIDQLRITDEDVKIARLLTPELPEGEYSVGLPWPLAWHQLRRTGAVNMFSSGLLSNSSMQFLMKHVSRLMPLYYGRGYTKLHLNGEVEGLLTSTMYEIMAESILAAMGDRFVSPHSTMQKDQIVVNLIGDRDAQSLAKAAQRGDIFFRETRLGACTKRGTCNYGGIESVARCAGGDEYKACSDALYDRTKVPAIERDLALLDKEMERLPAGSPRYQALLVERNGLENFLNVFKS
jgi:hypothetical protein